MHLYALNKGTYFRENNLVIFLHAVKSQCSKNPEDLCCRNGMGKCAALILGCGTIFGILLLVFGLFWFKMKKYCLQRKLNQPS